MWGQLTPSRAGLRASSVSTGHLMGSTVFTPPAPTSTSHPHSPTCPGPCPIIPFLPVAFSLEPLPEAPPTPPRALHCSPRAPNPRLPQPSTSFRPLAHCTVGGPSPQCRSRVVTTPQPLPPATSPDRLPSSHMPLFCPAPGPLHTRMVSLSPLLQHHLPGSHPCSAHECAHPFPGHLPP